MKDKILYGLLFVSVFSLFTFYDYMLNLKEVFAYAYSIIMVALSLVIYINTNSGSNNLTFIRESFREIKLVTWAKKNEVVSSTLIVIGIVVLSTVMISLFDMGIYKVISGNLH